MSACFSFLTGENIELGANKVIWTSQSKNAPESMPCGDSDMGLNVWVGKGDILFYMAKSGTFDENNSMLKLGRVRVSLHPNPFDGDRFKQELLRKNENLQNSY